MRDINKDHPLMASQQDITLAETDIRLRIKRWHDLQAVHMPHVNEALLSQGPSNAEIEDERLHLPSFFSKDERCFMSLDNLAEEEHQLRKGQVIECILQLRRSAKRLSAMRGLKKKGEKGQKSGSRATPQRHSVEFTQECLLRIYRIGRQALISLDVEGAAVEKQFPILVMDDLSRKPTTQKRQMGDSHRAEGALWGINPSAAYPAASSSPLLSHPSSSKSRHQQLPSAPISQSHQLNEADSTQSANYIRATVGAEESPGKLWNPVLGLSDEEVEMWELEGMLRLKLRLTLY